MRCAQFSTDFPLMVTVFMFLAGRDACAERTQGGGPRAGHFGRGKRSDGAVRPEHPSLVSADGRRYCIWGGIEFADGGDVIRALVNFGPKESS